MQILINILEQGLIFSIAALGVYITYKILDFPDLSVDGTFPLGAAVAAACIVRGINPFFASALALISGCLGGLITGILHVKFKITNLMSGILVMIGLYSVNLRIMTKANIPLFGTSTVFSEGIEPLIIISAFFVIVKLILDLFLNTKLGFLLKAAGDNEQLVTSLGVSKNRVKIIGLMLSNGFVALSGAIMAQQQGFADIGMGTGIVVMGLAAVILGESILKRVKVIKLSTKVVFGAVIYKAVVALALQVGLEPTDLKLITALIVVAALALNNSSISFKAFKKAKFS
ncbi:ABC transporter permease [Clostridium polynesiense]|uniref:ABC transporter permease n=1 Tax=Clostridium polynesiense TaxID=1325933 RepID=UPI00058CAE67|nr:ABC transporter [Clostridium polynesiense]